MDEHAHTMLVNAFKNFNTGSEEHLFFSQMVEKFRYIPNSWLLLNIKSSIEIISNKAMVTNIQRSPNPIILHFNEVLEHLEYTANINDYRRELYEPKAIEKILSLYHATWKYRVVFDSKYRNCFHCMLLDRKVVFNVSTNGLYYYNNVDHAIMLTNTVEENREVFNFQEKEVAKASRCTLDFVGYPYEYEFSNMASSNMISN